MNPNPRDPATRAALRAVWEKIPAIECKGLCTDSCGPVLMSAAEWDAVKRAGGAYEPGEGCLTCPKLDSAGRCTVYDVRPLICRLWGVVDQDGMRCPHGCAPARYLTNEESKALLVEMQRAGGAVPASLYRIVSTMIKNAGES